MEAGLKWAIGKNRREKCDFLGGEVGSRSFQSFCFVDIMIGQSRDTNSRKGEPQS